MQECQTKSVTTWSILGMLFFQGTFYGIVFVLMYWIITLNFTMLFISIVISLAQLLIKPGRRMWYKQFIFKYLRPQEYFHIDRYYEEEVSEDEKTMFGVHPHSIFSYGLLCNLDETKYTNEKLTNAIPLGSRFVLSLPIIGLHFKFWGVQSVGPQNLGRLMHQGKNIVLVPGGYEQATITTPKELRLFIKSRKGFIKYALKYNYTIRPVIVTNEHKAMNTLDIFTNLRLLLNKFKIPGCLYWSRYGFLFPPGVVMHTIVGKGIKGTRIYEKKEHPTHHEINQAHAHYIQQIKRLYQKHKQKNKGTPLAIY